MSIQGYTCGFMIDASGSIVLIEKLKPAWQAGLLNGVGGKIESGETPFDCMRREWREEIGYDHHDWDHVCSLSFPDSVVHFFRTFVDRIQFDRFTRRDEQGIRVNDAGERIIFAKANRVPRYSVDNLHWLIPLCLDPHGTIGGKIKEQAA